MIQPGDERWARQFSSPASNEDNLNYKQRGDSRLASVGAAAAEYRHVFASLTTMQTVPAIVAPLHLVRRYSDL